MSGGKRSRGDGAFVGVSDHAGWAAFVTVAADGTILDRRRVELVAAGLPSMPIHHPEPGAPLARTLELVERVRRSAERRAELALDELAKDVTTSIRGIALRACPPLPPTVAEQLVDARAKNVADWVMYRKALAGAADARGWIVRWYDAREVVDAACRALRVESLDDRFAQARKALGPPWNADHKLAMAAAIAAADLRSA